MMTDKLAKAIGKSSVITLAFIAGCNADEVKPPDVEELTDGGYGGTGDTGTDGGDANECWSSGAPANAVRWQCEGRISTVINGTLHVEVPDWIDGAETIREIIEDGRVYWVDHFGPADGESYDDPGIDACCLPEISSNEDGEGADETGADPPPDGSIPQAASACLHDCFDQACRAIPRNLRLAADEIPAGVPVEGPTYRDQLRDLANWVALHHGDCFHAMIDGGVEEVYGNYEVRGRWDVPNSTDWPDVTDLSTAASCEVYDWYLPEVGEAHACHGINDNNDEDPFGSGGSSMGGFDTFAPTGGGMKLEGPTILGVEASGTAPILGFGDACPRGECSRLDAWVGEDVLELQRMLLVTPSAMMWERDGLRLTVEDLHVLVEQPQSVPLLTQGEVSTFEIPAGELDVMFAGRVHGVPIKVTVPNMVPVTGSVVSLFDGSYGVVMDPFTVEHRDDYGVWTMELTLGDFVAIDQAPRASFVTQRVDGTSWLDASGSFDPDGDPLTFEWFLDDVMIGDGPTVAPTLPPGLSTVAVRVTDVSGRSSWSYGLTAIGE
ncbi:hypothetical protein [Paraliomyxa miuraensis]|uniref:hypothetical protein n=1 Tax=Paraliomyxa miuraensis TaxID=376150 RepID=UPI00225A7DEE|nr:hypothetical protein [Paraliomyxa miuraensis]MCX4240165.1 PKD domain-containing protein [Paraliomyxa miuraensis]